MANQFLSRHCEKEMHHPAAFSNYHLAAGFFVSASSAHSVKCGHLHSVLMKSSCPGIVAYAVITTSP